MSNDKKHSKSVYEFLVDSGMTMVGGATTSNFKGERPAVVECVDNYASVRVTDSMLTIVKVSVEETEVALTIKNVARGILQNVINKNKEGIIVPYKWLYDNIKDIQELLVELYNNIPDSDLLDRIFTNGKPDISDVFKTVSRRFMLSGSDLISTVYVPKLSNFETDIIVLLMLSRLAEEE